MYWCLRLYHITPRQFYDMPFREKQLMFAMVKYDISQRNKENSSEDKNDDTDMNSIDSNSMEQNTEESKALFKQFMGTKASR